MLVERNGKVLFSGNTERKHPLALIKAYWYAFQNKENVALVLKTYRSDYSDGEKNAIRTTIKRLKQVTPMVNYPPIYLIPNMLTNDEIYGLHTRGDCYVSLDRGEGFGLSPFTAGAYGKPIIVTGFGGSTEYAKEDNSYLVNYTLTPVFGMPWSPWYRGDQLWAEPDIIHGANLMKHVFENQDEATARGKKLQNYIKENFVWEAIGKKIVDGIKSL
jgi:glycosyltransferase involved in cell wall biosynthesis